MLTQENKERLNRLIQHQADWIKSLQENQEKLEKYRDGILPFDERRIADIANAQSQLAQAAKNIAQAITTAARED